jgi:hypothetical protein
MYGTGSFQRIKRPEHDDNYLLPSAALKKNYSYTSAVTIYIIANYSSMYTDGRIILRWIFRKWDVGVWTESSWLRIGTDGGNL